jgi:hypothetical protein
MLEGGLQAHSGNSGYTYLFMYILTHVHTYLRVYKIHTYMHAADLSLLPNRLHLSVPIVEF